MICIALGLTLAMLLIGCRAKSIMRGIFEPCPVGCGGGQAEEDSPPLIPQVKGPPITIKQSNARDPTDADGNPGDDICPTPTAQRPS